MAIKPFKIQIPSKEQQRNRGTRQVILNPFRWVSKKKTWSHL